MRRTAIFMLAVGLVLGAVAAWAQSTAELTAMKIERHNHPLVAGASE